MQDSRYQKFSSNIDFNQIDHIVVGSGIGGLTCATWLAKTGKKVLVLERHYVPGGFTHSFKRKNGFQWDVGVHYVGNVSENGSLKKLFDFISSGKLEWEGMGDIYDVVYIGDEKYEFKAGIDNFKEQLISYFPEEKKAIIAYLGLIEKSNRWSSAFFFEKTFKPILRYSIGWFIRKGFKRYSEPSTYDVLAKLTHNKRLIAVLCAQCGNYGLAPKKSSFAAHALIVGHFIEGGYYPKGGADQIALKTIDTLRNHGGEVYINAEVSKIVTEKGRVKGVIVNDHFIACKSVISNVGVRNTYYHLLSEKDRLRSKVDLKKMPSSTGHMCLYIGLDKNAQELKLPKHNVWQFDNENFDTLIDELDWKNAADQFSYISFPSAKDSEWKDKHPNTATIQAISVGRIDWFEKYDGQEWMKKDKSYMDMKVHFEKQMLNKLYKLYPQIKEHVVFTEVSTPLSTKHFSNYQNGEIYGLAHSPERFRLPFLRPETKIKGLTLVGQDITLVGVAGAMLSGMLAAIILLKFKTIKLFKEMNG